MRALGPGSVSSLLKIVLDVIYVALIAGVALALLGALLSLNPALLARVRFSDGSGVASSAPVVIGGLLAGGAYMAGLTVILGALRQIFLTLTAGDPFQPGNVGRLRLIGLTLAGLELGRYLVLGISTWLPRVRGVSVSFNPTPWFSVLVVFVLAEVFREGARLRGEAELTI